MFVNHLLFAVAVDHDRKIVEAANHTAQLKAVYQVDSDRHRILPDLVQKRVLDVDRLLQNVYLLCTY